MSTREENKESNRKKILAAARELLHQGGLEALAMRALAERAKVSSRTPYNLFGSKTDVLIGLLDEPLRRFSLTALPIAGNRLLPTLLAMVDVVYGQYAPEIDYYRTIFWGLMSSDHQAARAGALDRARRLAEMLIRGAIATGEMRADTDPATVADHLVAVIAGLLGLWAAGLLSGPQLAAEVRRSMLLGFLAYGNAALRPELEADLARLDQPLSLAIA